jgi:hypothetical protein
VPLVADKIMAFYALWIRFFREREKTREFEVNNGSH